MHNRQDHGGFLSPSVSRANLLSVHAKVAADMRQKMRVPDFIKLRRIAQRKQVQIAFFGNCLSPWEELAHNTYGKPDSFFEHRQLIVEMMRHSYLPQLEAFYGCSITNYYMFEPHYVDNIIYGFTAKLFSVPLFKDVDARHASLEEKLGNAFTALIRHQYGFRPTDTVFVFWDNRFLAFIANSRLTTFRLSGEKLAFLNRSVSFLFFPVLNSVWNYSGIRGGFCFWQQPVRIVDRRTTQTLNP